mgnify:CR=1 FL=1
MKVGVAKIEGKRPQIMFKLASDTPKQIRGILKPIIIKGKARGKLVYCSHEEKLQYIVVDGKILFKALSATMQYLNKLPPDEEHEKIIKKKTK